MERHRVVQAGCFDTVDDPKNPMNGYSPGFGNRAQNAVAGQKRPLPSLSQRESQGVGERELSVGAAQLGGAADLVAFQRFDDDTKGAQPLTEVGFEFSFEEERGCQGRRSCRRARMLCRADRRDQGQ